MNKFEKRSIKSYDKKADNYDNTFDGKFTVKLKNALLKMVSISKNDYVLDVACGNGRLLEQFHKQGVTFHGFGTDISNKMIYNAKKINPSMEFQVAGCDALPYKDQSMNVVTVCAAFHHFPDVEKFATEVTRVMKTTGTIYIAEVYLPKLLRILCNPFVKFSKAGDVKFYSPEEIISLFEKNGFEKKEVFIKRIMQVIAMDLK